MVNRLEDSDFMPGEISSDHSPDRSRKAKRNLRDSMLSLGLVKWLKASVQEAPQVTKDGAMQHQGTARARESEDVVDKGGTGGLGHTEVASTGNLGRGPGEGQGDRPRR